MKMHSSGNSGYTPLHISFHRSCLSENPLSSLCYRLSSNRLCPKQTRYKKYIITLSLCQQNSPYPSISSSISRLCISDSDNSAPLSSKNNRSESNPLRPWCTEHYPESPYFCASICSISSFRYIQRSIFLPVLFLCILFSHQFIEPGIIAGGPDDFPFPVLPPLLPGPRYPPQWSPSPFAPLNESFQLPGDVLALFPVIPLHGLVSILGLRRIGGASGPSGVSPVSARFPAWLSPAFGRPSCNPWKPPSYWVTLPCPSKAKMRFTTRSGNTVMGNRNPNS